MVHHLVTYSTDPRTEDYIASEFPSHTIPSLSPGTSYNVHFQANKSEGSSGWSSHWTGCPCTEVDSINWTESGPIQLRIGPAPFSVPTAIFVSRLIELPPG